MPELAERILTARGTVIFALGQAGYIVKSDSGQLLAIDLYLSECVERIEGNTGFKRLLPQLLQPGDLPLDIVICTHPHLDHFDVDAIPEMLAKGSKLFCSVDCEKLVRQFRLEYYGERITYVRPGDTAEIGDFRIAFVNCDHGAGAPDAVGAVIEVDGKTIYEAGDTRLRLDRVSEILQPLDVLIAPINGMFGNMDSADCALLAEALKPSITIPSHYGMFASHGGDLKAFYDVMSEKRLPFMLMRQGESLRIK